MRDLINAVRTPYKIGKLVLEPSFRMSFDSHAVDCPFLFFHEGTYYMTYVGWDTVGYRSGLASSADLLNWKKEGMIIDRGEPGTPTEYNVALTSILRDNNLFGKGEIKKVNKKFIGTYHAYPAKGYEQGAALIGLCFSEDLRNWDIGEPVLLPDEGAEWERGGLYKSWLLEQGGVFYLFYNAKNKADWPWTEQIGFATSRDLKKWTRHKGNPVLEIGSPGDFDDVFVADPCVLWCVDRWGMFYYGLCSDGHARTSVAFSRDLYSWEKSYEILLDIGFEGSVDSIHAHKSGVIAAGKKIFHFYCAVSPDPEDRHGAKGELRGISFANS